MTTISSAEPTRRDFLYVATGTVGAVGAAAVAWPLISQMNPDASTIAAGAPIEVDLAPIAEGQVIKVFWRSRPIFIGHRSKKEIDEARAVNVASLPDPQPDTARVKQGKEQWLVLIGICTHLGCIPLSHQGQYDGFFCPCHGSVYDTSGRIRQGPAPARRGCGRRCRRPSRGTDRTSRYTARNWRAGCSRDGCRCRPRPAICRGLP